MATIEKRRAKDGSLSYRVKIRSKGVCHESETFKRLTDARRYVRQMEAQIAEGRYFPLSEARRHTVGDAIERYVVHVLPRKRLHTAVQQRQQLSWWTERVGHLRLSEVTPGAIVAHREALAREIASSSVNRYFKRSRACREPLLLASMKGNQGGRPDGLGEVSAQYPQPSGTRPDR